MYYVRTRTINKYKNKSNDCHCIVVRGYVSGRFWSALYGRIDWKANKIKTIENLYKRQTANCIRQGSKYEFENRFNKSLSKYSLSFESLFGNFSTKKIICFAVMSMKTLNDGLSFNFLLGL